MALNSRATENRRLIADFMIDLKSMDAHEALLTKAKLKSRFQKQKQRLKNYFERQFVPNKLNILSQKVVKK